MADNIPITPGSGAQVATNDIGGVHYQRNKLIDGTPGSTDFIPGDSTFGMKVQVTKQAPLPTGGNTIGSVGVNGIAAGEDHLGEVGSKSIPSAIVFTPYTGGSPNDGSILADTQVLTGALRIADGTGVLQDVMFNDKSNMGQPFDVWILTSAVSLGTEGSSPNISANNADNIIGKFSVVAADWYALGPNCKLANPKNIGITVKAAAGTANLYIALIYRGSGGGAYIASGITATFKILAD
jgi:hypothetical protein